MKFCKDCKQTLSLDKFYRKKDGLSNNCKSCNNLKRRAHKLKFPKTDFTKDRNYWFKRKYGISLEDRESLLNTQNYCCKLCSRPFSEFKKGSHVDHCHKTHEIRSMLCPLCNLGLGAFKDNPELLRKAACYLEEFKET